VKIAIEGLMIGGVARRLGTIVSVPDEEADRLRATGHVHAPALVKVNEYNRLVGARVCQPGEIVAARSIQHAIDLHASGAADFINAEALGAALPARLSPFAVPAGHMRIRALVSFGQSAEHVPEGAFRVFTRARAEHVISQGMARPEKKGIRLVILLDNARANGKPAKAGDNVAVDEAEADSLVLFGKAAYLPDVPAAASARAPAVKREKITS
jgi:hypothetical protein